MFHLRASGIIRKGRTRREEGAAYPAITSRRHHRRHRHYPHLHHQYRFRSRSHPNGHGKGLMRLRANVLQRRERVPVQGKGDRPRRVNTCGTESQLRPLPGLLRLLGHALPARLRGRPAQEALERWRHPMLDDSRSLVSKNGVSALPVAELPNQLEMLRLPRTQSQGRRQNEGEQGRQCEPTS